MQGFTITLDFLIISVLLVFLYYYDMLDIVIDQVLPEPIQRPEGYYRMKNMDPNDYILLNPATSALARDNNMIVTKPFIGRIINPIALASDDTLTFARGVTELELSNMNSFSGYSS